MFEPASQPEHSFGLRLPVEAAVGPFDAQPGERGLHLAQGDFVLTSVADVRKPVFELVGQVEGRRVSVARVLGHRLQADRFQRRIDRAAQPARGRENAPRHAAENIRQVSVRKWGPGRPVRSRGSPPGCRRR